jgi:hypothetical protein
MACDLNCCEPPPCAGAFFSTPSLALDLVAQLCQREPLKALSRVSRASRRAALAACSSISARSDVALGIHLACAAVFMEHGARIRSLHFEGESVHCDRDDEIAAAAAKRVFAAARSEAAPLALPRLGAIETLCISACKQAVAPGDMAALSALTGLRKLGPVRHQAP